MRKRKYVFKRQKLKNNNFNLEQLKINLTVVFPAYEICCVVVLKMIILQWFWLMPEDFISFSPKQKATPSGMACKGNQVSILVCRRYLCSYLTFFTVFFNIAYSVT
ncbi:hypothetical protein VF13_40025, partial [Nostoc linckia z16]